MISRWVATGVWYNTEYNLSCVSRLEFRAGLKIRQSFIPPCFFYILHVQLQVEFDRRHNVIWHDNLPNTFPTLKRLDSRGKITEHECTQGTENGVETVLERWEWGGGGEGMNIQWLEYSTVTWRWIIQGDLVYMRNIWSFVIGSKTPHSWRIGRKQPK